MCCKVHYKSKHPSNYVTHSLQSQVFTIALNGTTITTSTHYIETYNTSIRFTVYGARNKNYTCLMLSEMDNYYFFLENCNMSRSLFSLFIFEHAKGNECISFVISMRTAILFNY